MEPEIKFYDEEKPKKSLRKKAPQVEIEVEADVEAEDTLLTLQKCLGNIEANMRSQEGYNYISLGALLATVKPILSGLGLVITQTTLRSAYDHEGRMCWGLHTELCKAGVKSPLRAIDMPLPAYQLHEIREVGAALTYLRRYSIMIILGLATEDSDGKSSRSPIEAVPVATKVEVAPTPTPEPAINPNDSEVALKDFLMMFAHLKSMNKLHLLPEKVIAQFEAIEKGAKVSAESLVNARNFIQKKLGEDSNHGN